MPGPVSFQASIAGEPMLLRRSLPARAGTFAVSAAAGLAIALNAPPGQLPAAWLTVALVALLLLNVLHDPRVVILRETTLYAAYVAYMLVALSWTSDRVLALNTLLPAANFVIIMVLVGSLATLHHKLTVLAGMMTGVAAGAAFYTLQSGFPFRYPAEFSYNAVAGMYLLGLVVTLMLAAVSRWKGVLLLVAVVFMAHIVATTSIKTNLGIAAGVLAVAAVHFRRFVGALGRNAILLAAFAGCAVWFAMTQDSVRASFERGIDRISLGVKILANREGNYEYSAFDERTEWARAGIRGWLENPLFGHGVEAFRDRYGITSHSTIVDVLYNTGLIGFVLFYALFASLLWRLYRMRAHVPYEVRGVVFGGAICYLFISLSGTMHYSAFLAACLALSIALVGGGARETQS